MSRDLASALQERWAEYLRFYREGAIYSAFVRLSEIANCLQHASVPSDLASRWANALGEVKIKPDDLRSISEEVRRKIERVRRMLGVSTGLIYEEFLFAITIRTELDLLAHYLAERGAACLADADSLDADLVAMAGSPRSSSAYRSAQASARQNWGLPLYSKWLGSDATQ